MKLFKIIKRNGKKLVAKIAPEYVIHRSSLFDEKWYAQEYGVLTGQSSHYLNEGWKLGYDPSPAFKTNEYLRCNYDVFMRDINPLLHYEVFGRSERRSYTAAAISLDKSTTVAMQFATNLSEIRKSTIVRPYILSDPLLAHIIVDIIVPIYNGYQYLSNLTDSIEKTTIPYRLILIDDCSTDDRVSSYLSTYATAHENAFYIRNETNEGFVKTVNKGLRISVGNVVILNTDVIVPNNWLEYLIYPIVHNEKIASTTPFTNSGTICSFPEVGKDNERYLDLDVDTINETFTHFEPIYPEIPTGVGFCMGMSRKALDAVGYFDEELFEKGYGEENDWCCRALKKGFIHVHVNNLYVFHNHGGSFQSKEKEELCKKHLEILKEKYPDYLLSVAQYLLKDPLREMREVAKFLLSNKKIYNKTILAFDHNLGGGATSYLDQQIKRIVQQGDRVLVCRNEGGGTGYRFECCSNDWAGVLSTKGSLTETLYSIPFSINEIWINELFSYAPLDSILKEIIDFAGRNKISVHYMLHDYFSVCPTINLMHSGTGLWCGLPKEMRVCNTCLQMRKKDLSYSDTAIGNNIDLWRNMWRSFLYQCDEIRVFSQSSQNIFENIFPGLTEKIHCNPHQISYLPFIQKRYKTKKTINIGLIGVMGLHKGEAIIQKMCSLLEKENAPVRFVLIGEGRDLGGKITITGRYQRPELPWLLMKNDIDIVFVSSVVPETFSYTTQEAMSIGFPVACFDVGAPAERVTQYHDGVIISGFDPNHALRTIVDFVNQRILPKRIQRECRKILFIVDEKESFTVRYRVGHFMEELLFHGVDADILLSNDSDRIDYEQYKRIVIYRSTNVKLLKVIEMAKKLGIDVLYDIDDLVFSEDLLPIDSFKPDERKRLYDNASALSSIMAHCDAFITSTNSLSGVLRKRFSKHVFVHRNAASMEMETISATLLEAEEIDSDSVILGYMSGSWTHQQDFDGILTTIHTIMDKYDNVRLVLFGCMDLPDLLKHYGKRIVLEPFQDWRNIPAVMRTFDINLMPLEDSLFNHCKSENKWLEAALVARPTIASYNSELAEIIQQNETGLLCRTQEEWFNSLERMINSKALRETIGHHAHEYVMQHYLTRNCNNDEVIKMLLSPPARERTLS